MGESVEDVRYLGDVVRIEAETFQAIGCITAPGDDGVDGVVENVADLIALIDNHRLQGNIQLNPQDWKAFRWLRDDAKTQGEMDINRDVLNPLVNRVMDYHEQSLCAVYVMGLHEFRLRLQAVPDGWECDPPFGQSPPPKPERSNSSRTVAST
ncbi:MAG: hypothetical protein ABGZ53_36265, partial [Fuerstiella sp.]